MSSRRSLLTSIAGTIADYRAGDIAPPTPDHVETWVEQFDTELQKPMLEELDHVLKKTYFSKPSVQEFLASLVKNKKLTGADPCSFWKDVKFLDIQAGGNSQREMLQMFDSILEEECGLGIEDCGNDPEHYLYLDDAIFTGNRVLRDLREWISADAPKKAAVHVVTIGLHRGGQYYAKTELERAAQGASKTIDLQWWRSVEIEDRRAYTSSSDVLRPTRLPADELTQEYVQTLSYAPVLRQPGSLGENGFFSSEDGRNLLEQEFLKAGVRIRSQSPYLNVYQRPLGNMVLQTLGFGSLLVTFRNCPNNCPLAFWAGNPWYPLFPRKTN